jgi:uncharacterized protein (DUF2132 family)
MTDEINHKNNPLNGVGLKRLLTEIVDHYGFEILFAYLNINCFKTNPSIDSSVKFLKKTDWAREKVELFYLYQFKNLPRVSSSQFSQPPRARIVPDGQCPGEPAELSLEDAERLREKRAKKSAVRDRGVGARGAGHRSGSDKRYGGRQNRSAGLDPTHSGAEAPDVSRTKGAASTESVDPWAAWKNRS